MAVNKKYDFSGKVALVTGSSSGIGEEIAVQLAMYGARVTITGRNRQTLDSVVARIKSLGGPNPLVVLGDLFQDVSLPNQLIDRTLACFGRLDILVNNAGCVFKDDNLANPNLMVEFDRVFQVNLRSVLQLIQLAVPHLVTSRGNIINISSIGGIRPLTLSYSMSKAAMDMMTKFAAQELGPKGVRVNSINPGPIATKIFRSVGIDEQSDVFASMVREWSVMDRVAMPEEVAHLASFLASDDAANITGTIMVTDGGCLVRKDVQI